MLVNCTSGGKTLTLPVEEIERNKTIHEVIVFVGNPGVVESSLINSIIQEPVFKSEVSGGIGLTRQEQSYVHENKLYIDIPAIDDINLRQQAAVEIEKALKLGNKYKIVFVATLESGRIRPADIVAINTVCAAIKTDFEYGLIISKTTKEDIAKLGEKQGIMKFFQSQLCKQPSSVLTLKFDGGMYDKENKYFSEQFRNKEALVNFVNQLTAKNIKQEDVVKLDIMDFEARVTALEEAHKKELAAMEKQLQVSEEERKLEEERHKGEQQQYRADQAKQETRHNKELVRLEERFKKEREETERQFSGQIHELKTGGTPLHTAAWQGDLEALTMLLQATANVNVADNEGMTPLYLAVAHDQVEAVKMLLQAKANVNVPNHYSSTPLHYAASHSQVEVVKALLQAKASINTFDKEGKTPLHNAAYHGQVESVKTLLQAKTNVNVHGDYGTTPLYWAAAACTLHGVEVVQTLLQAEANVNVVDRGGDTPLHWVAPYGHLGVIQTLLQVKAKVNVADKEGKTPLHKAASRGRVESVQTLLQATANVNTLDNKGKTPLDTAAKMGHQEVVQALIQAGAQKKASDEISPGCKTQ